MLVLALVRAGGCLPAGRGLAAADAAIAVVVQQLVRSDVSFVVFTADPVGDRDGHLVIAATWGLGEAVVSGLVVPDHIVVGPDGQVVDYAVGDKHLMVISGLTPGDGTREVPVPRDGWLAAPDDIFMLTGDEVRTIIADVPIDEAIQRVRALVQERRQEMAIAQTLTPPPFIGPSPDGPPPTGNPLERAIIRFFGGPPQVSETPGQLKGTAGSKGIATGPARVARTLEEATAVLPGEILVAVTTMPPWTPLFGIAAAIVTETGGPLSYCAIVAREYGIPAVVGAHGATKAIASGQQVTVDGGRGIVMIEG